MDDMKHERLYKSIKRTTVLSPSGTGKSRTAETKEAMETGRGEELLADCEIMLVQDHSVCI
jgi:hypothetical protein